MIPRIRQLLHLSPFQPFSVRTSDGREFLIPTSDHAMITPSGARLIILHDDDTQTDVAALHIASVLINGNVETA